MLVVDAVRAARRSALVVAGLLLAIVLRPLIASALAGPLGLAYVVAVRYVESLPQIYLWAVLLGAFVLIGLRRLPLRDAAKSPGAPRQISNQGRLGAWVELLADRRRGTYFEWRLANRLAELERWIGAPDELDARSQSYLEFGRNQRTIHAASAAAPMNFKLERLVAYLEDALRRS